ncbi:hypothetical protein BD560DRAFT_451175 [Blakeslea trispora]|nr:hypothetical protein BD560DRAFT_451175 [Blakeslea trispora]
MYHCECNWIEMYWGMAKREARLRCDYTFKSLERNIPAFLDKAGNITQIRRYFQRCMNYIEAYSKQERGREVVADVKKFVEKRYLSHRKARYQVSDFILLTETWTTESTPINMDGFQVIARVNVEGKRPKSYGSLVAVNESRLMSLEDVAPIEILKKTNDGSISVSGFTSRYILVLCIYKSPRADIHLLENLIEAILLQNNGRVIVAGDFNIDFTSTPSSFRDLLSKLNLTSALPVEIATTTKHGTFIDNIFTNFEVKNSGRYISYPKSSHDPLYINFE